MPGFEVYWWFMDSVAHWTGCGEVRFKGFTLNWPRLAFHEGRIRGFGRSYDVCTCPLELILQQ